MRRWAGPRVRIPVPRALSLMAAMLLVIMACTRQAITIEPRALFRGIPDLRATGRATLEVHPGGTYELLRDHVIDARFGAETRRLTVDELVAHCPEVAPFRGDTYRPSSPCLLLETTSARFTLDRRVRADGGTWKLVAGALLAAVVIGVVVGYVTDCRDPDDGC